MKVSSALWNNNESVLNELSTHFPASAEETIKKLTKAIKFEMIKIIILDPLFIMRKSYIGE